MNGLRQDLAAAQQQLQQTEQRAREQIAQMEQQVGQIRQEETELRTQVTAYQQQSQQMVGRIEQNVTRERLTAQQQAQDSQSRIDELRGQVDTMQREVEALRNRVPRPDTEAAVLRQADGQVISIPSKDIVFVNLGQRDSVMPGLTFEVYDSLEGVPALAPQDVDVLPQGKASIEITSVGPATSEARVTRLSYGAILAEGDKVANLVYDRNTRYTFMVYGAFDLDQNGVPTPQDADVVKRLVTEWGGKLTDRVNVDTDFVVLGQEPVLPEFSREELNDPFNAKRLADAQASLDQYLSIRETAARLRIPIVNQNRFLYLIGYYAQAPR
jgi:regulator of replication initiation timing